MGVFADLSNTDEERKRRQENAYARTTEAPRTTGVFRSLEDQPARAIAPDQEETTTAQVSNKSLISQIGDALSNVAKTVNNLINPQKPQRETDFQSAPLNAQDLSRQPGLSTQTPQHVSDFPQTNQAALQLGGTVQNRRETQTGLKLDYVDQKALDRYLTLPTFFSNPAIAVDQTTLDTEPPLVGMQLLLAPAKGIHQATDDFLRNNPRVTSLLAQEQDKVEKSAAFNAPGLAGFTKGVAETYLGSSQSVQAVLDTKIAHHEGVAGYGDSVGEALGQIAALWFGGASLKELGVPAKAIMPSLFATIGQTSETPDTTLRQRIAKLPVDAAVGLLFGMIPGSQDIGYSDNASFLKNAQNFFLSQAARQTYKVGAVTGAQGTVDALIRGMKPEDAARVGAQSALIGSFFHVVATSTGVLANEVLASKEKSGAGIFTPEQVRTRVVQAQSENSPEGQYLMNLATKAEASGKNVSIDMNATVRSKVAKKLGLATPSGLKLRADIVDAPARITPAEGSSTNAPATPAPTTPPDQNLNLMGIEEAVSRGNVAQAENLYRKLDASDPAKVRARKIIDQAQAEPTTTSNNLQEPPPTTQSATATTEGAPTATSTNQQQPLTTSEVPIDQLTPQRLSKEAVNSLENDQTGVKKDRVALQKDLLSKDTQRTVEVRRLDNGDLTIVDGRHALEAARQNPDLASKITVKDVTAQYAEKPAKQPVEPPTVAKKTTVEAQKAAKVITPKVQKVTADTDIATAAQARMKELVNEQVKYLKDTSKRGVTQGSITRDAEGRVAGRTGRISNNPAWYRQALKETGKKSLSNADYIKIAQAQLAKGYKDETAGKIPPHGEYRSLLNLTRKAPTGTADVGGYAEQPREASGRYGAKETATRLVRVGDNFYPESKTHFTREELGLDENKPSRYIRIGDNFYPAEKTKLSRAEIGLPEKSLKTPERTVTVADMSMRVPANVPEGSKLIYHGGKSSFDVVKERGVRTGENAEFGKGVYFTDSTETAGNFSDDVNKNYAVPLRAFKFLTIDESPMQYVQRERPGSTMKDLPEIIQSKGTYDGFVVTNPDERVGNTYVVTNLDKLNSINRGEGIPPSSPSKAGSFTQYGDAGGYAETPLPTGTVNQIRTVEFPELVKLARELSGDVPGIKKMKNARGVFRSKTGKIALDPSIFADPVGAAKTLAHEIGHLSDWLPDKNIKRGNLVGRIASLNKYMKKHFGDLLEGKGEVNNEILVTELKKLTQIWKSFDEETNPSFTKYRYSSPELYADAISVMFNDPELLKSTAPHFWHSWFDYLDKKPAVQEAFFGTWDLLNKGEEAVLSQRDQDIRAMFQRGEDLYTAKTLEQTQRDRNVAFKFKFDHIDRNYAMIDRINKLKKQGIYLSDDENPIYQMEAHNYVGGVVKAYLEESIQPVYKALGDSHVSWEDFGQVLFLERVMHERGELANPLGFTPKTAQDQMTFLEQQMGADKWRVVQAQLPRFRAAISQIVDQAEGTIYSKEVVAKLRTNPAYATFQVLDYLDTYIPASIKQQVGTLKEISNPAEATIIKTISLIRAIEKNKVKTKVADTLLSYFPKDIEKAKTIYNGRVQVPVESKDPDKALFTRMVNGKLESYYVDPYIAKALDKMSTGHTHAVVEVLRFLNNKQFRPLFITYNLGFQSFNAVRDFKRFYKNVPGLPLWRAFKRYTEAIRPSYRRAIGASDATILEMEKSKILSVTYNDIVKGAKSEDMQIDRILQKSGVLGTGENRRAVILRPFLKILDMIETTGNFIETLPKVAGYKELQGKMPSNELGSFIRTSVGSPDFLRKGAASAWSNDLFLFSNAIKEGMRSDYNVAFKNPRTRAGYWWKMAMLTIVPKLLMYGAAIGIFGGLLKRMFGDVSEYDKTNYQIVPLSNDGTRTTYLRIPDDETGRLWGGLLWKAVNAANQGFHFKDVADVASYAAGNLPSLNPMINLVVGTAQFMAGQNPYDFYRNQSVIPDTEFKAGGTYALKPFVTWQLQNLGFGTFMQLYTTEQAPDTKSWGQKLIEAPVASNILGRWIKVSNQGQKEAANKLLAGVKSEAAATAIDNRNKLNEAIRTYRSGEMNDTRRKQLERQLVRDIVGDAPYTGTRKAEATRTVNNFRQGIIKGEGDANINALIRATSNEEKTLLLKSLKDELSTNEYQDLTNRMLKQKIISKKVVSDARKE